MTISKSSTSLEEYNKVIDKAVLAHIDEWQRKRTELWLLNELHYAEETFGEGEDITEFAIDKLDGFSHE